MVKNILSILFSIISLSCLAQNYIDYNKNGKQDIFENKDFSIEERVENLLNQMTFEEKQGQLLMDLGWQYYTRENKNINLTSIGKNAIQEKKIGSLWGFFRADPWTQKTLQTGITPQLSHKGINQLQKYVIDSTRLGIPILIAEECMHGIMQVGSTVFPTGLGQASTWDRGLITMMSLQIGGLSKQEGINICFGPLLDLAKDPRWSRVEETMGEDYYLTSEIGKSFVKGLKLNAADSNKIVLPTLKHFAAYGHSEGGHNAGASHLGVRELHSEVLFPFKRAIEEGADLVMTAYNEIDGIPCTMNPYLLKDILRNRWNFKGVVISDLHSISGLRSHKVAKNLKQAAEKSIYAGVDLDLSATDFYNNLIDVDTAQLNEAVRRVLRLKFLSGLMDNPFIQEYQENKGIISLNSQREIALNIAEQGIVLMENKESILPLNNGKGITVALIGPNADNIYNQLGDYTAPQSQSTVTTIKAAFENYKKENKNFNYLYSKGCSIRDTNKDGFSEAISIAKQSNIIVLCLGGSSSRYEEIEYENTGAAKINSKTVADITSGEGFDRSSLDLAGVQKDLLDTLYTLGKPIVLVLINGRPLVLTDIREKCSAILECFYPGAEGGHAVLNTLIGKNNPSGRLPISFPRSVGALPCYYNAKNVGNRADYLEGKSTPLYPFGYGLSYTNFKIDNANIKAYNQGTDSVFYEIECNITNTGSYDGAEVIQVYRNINTSLYASNAKQLCAFQKTFLKKGESKYIKLKIDNEFFREWNIDATEFLLSKGEYTLSINKDSQTPIYEFTINIE